MLVGATFWGTVSDRIGRRAGMGWASAMTRIAAALVTLLGASVIAGSLKRRADRARRRWPAE